MADPTEQAVPLPPADYSSMSLADRVTRGLQELTAYGVSRAKAIHLVSIAGKETSHILTVPRPPKVGSDRCRFTVPVGIEWDFKNGRGYVPVSAAASEIWKDPDFSGLLTWDADLNRAYAIGALNAAGPTSAKALLFEKGMAREDHSILRIIALGANQYNIRWSSPLNPNGQSACGYPSGLDAIWAWYLSPAGQWADALHAFDAPCSSAGYLVAGMSDDLALKIVRRQTGTSPGIAEAYWGGGPPFSGTPALRDIVVSVTKRADELGL